MENFLTYFIFSLPVIILAIGLLTDTSTSTTRPQETRGKNHHYLGRGLSAQEETVLTGPPTVWKSTHLHVDKARKQVLLRSLAHGNLSSADADSKCEYHDHSFKNDCSCGFYAYKEKRKAENHNQNGNGTTLLECVASGEYVEYGEGWRYSHQRVTGINPLKCGWCSNPAQLFQERIDTTTLEHLLWGTCINHFFNKRDIWSFEKVAVSLSGQVVTKNAAAITVPPGVLTQKEVETKYAPVSVKVGKTLLRGFDGFGGALIKTANVAQTVSKSSTVQKALTPSTLKAKMFKKDKI